MVADWYLFICATAVSRPRGHPSFEEAAAFLAERGFGFAAGARVTPYGG
jgi:hypothetical protein